MPTCPNCHAPDAHLAGDPDASGQYPGYCPACQHRWKQDIATNESEPTPETDPSMAPTVPTIQCPACNARFGLIS